MRVLPVVLLVLLVAAGLGLQQHLTRQIDLEGPHVLAAASDGGFYLATGTRLYRLDERERVEARYEAGLSLQGWELKAIRAGRANIGESYAMIKNGEIFLFGARITPLIQATTHVVADDRRNRKLLLHRREIDTLIGHVERDGYTIIPTAMYWKGNKIKLEVALAKGKQAHDKRASDRDRDWNREKQQVMRRHNKYG